MHLRCKQLGLVLILGITQASCGGGGGGGGGGTTTALGDRPGQVQVPPPTEVVTPTPTPTPTPIPTPDPTVSFTRTGANSGGATTLFAFDQDAFNRAAPNLNQQGNQRNNQGNGIFDRNFNPAGAQNAPGLGPIFNSNSCNGCHVRDGRGSQPPPGQPLRTMLLRLSVAGTTATGGPAPAPGFGGQLQDKAIPGVVPEAGVAITQALIPGTFGDGTPFSLESPSFTLTNPHTALPAGLMISPRVAPHIAGLGLLEAIPEASILALADENDANGDGISGKASRVWDVVNNRQVLGRFGWKAGAPTLLQQSAAAFRNDMGLTNPLFTTEASLGQQQHDGLADDPEINANMLDQVAFYTQTLGVPGRRNVNDQTVLRGEEVFHQANCAKCHTPILQTGVHTTPTLTPQAPTSIAALGNQTIQPFTDMLLHDMGAGLADNRPDGLATGQEWRTPPLWGIGLFQTTNGHTRYLHDGRARNLSEAILWHGGEAQGSRDAFAALSATDRTAILAFLNSL